MKNSLGQTVTMTKVQAAQEFKELYADTIASGDKGAIRWAWSTYTDGLHRDGRISDSQVFRWLNPVLKAGDQ